MGRITYRVVAAKGGRAGGYYVELTEPGAAPRITDNFPTMGAAYSWIDRAKEQEQARAQRPRRRWQLSFRRHGLAPKPTPSGASLPV